MVYKFRCNGIMREYIRDPAANISLVATIKGEIKEEHLRTALKKVRNLHKLLGLKVIFNENNEAWLSDKNVPPIPLKVIERESDKKWKDIVSNEVNAYLDIEKGPLIRYILLKSAEYCDIIIIGHHAICDALSLANLVHDTLLFLSEPEKKVETLQPVFPVSKYFHENSFFSKLELMLNRVYFNMNNRKWDKQKILFDKNDYHDIQNAFYDKYRYKIIDTELSSLKTSALVNQCRKYQVTINSALIVAFLAANYDIRGVNNNQNIEIGVNIRNEFKMNVENNFGFLASCINVDFRYDPQKTFWENVDSFHNKVGPVLEENEIIKNYRRAEYMDPTLVDAVKFATYGEWVFDELKDKKLLEFLKNEDNMAVTISRHKISSMPDMSISNLGRLNFPSNYGFLELQKIYMLTNSLPSLDLVVGAVTTGGNLTLTLNYMEDRASDKTLQMEMIMNRAMEYLNEAGLSI